MQKYYPYIFPAIALLLVGFLAFRWYNLRTQREGEISPFGEGVEIEDLTVTETEDILKGTGDLQSVALQGADGYQGEVRYELTDDKIKFSVNANLPKPGESQYQVWLKEVNGQNKRKAFKLVLGKGGYMGSAAIDVQALPFEIVVSQELVDDNLLEEVLLRGIITKNSN